MSVRILSVNARGLLNDQKRRSVFDKYRVNADFLIIQETHSSKEVEDIWQSEWGGKIVFSHGTNMVRGIAIFIKKGLEHSISNVDTDQDGRLVIINIEINNIIATLVALYAPNVDNPKFFRTVGQMLRNRSEHKILIGDFNLTLDVDLDRLNTYCNNEKAKTEVENIMDEYSLKDIWRERNSELREYSWIKKGSYPMKASRIDYALISGGLDQYTQMVYYVSSIFTDHRAVYVVVEVDNLERGRGFWKLNTGLLQNKEYVELINSEVGKLISNSQSQKPHERWEDIKSMVKELTVKFARKQSSENKLIISQLSERVNYYESQLPLTREEDNLLCETKQELENLMIERIKGIMFRSKVQWAEQGEMNTKYFFSLEKARYNSKTCYKLVDEQGKEVTGQDNILQLQKAYYESLYSVDEDVSFGMENIYGVYVPEGIRETQEIQLTLDDLAQATKSMNNKKTPGQDGIPVDFYKVFWNLLKDAFYEMVIYNYQEQIMHDSARKGVLNLIPKPGKDSRLIKNLRPITLLNTDYKIVEKAVANKMLPALSHIIGADQRGFMKDRRISVNIRKMLDIMHQAEKEDLEAVVLSLDFVKCFDKCSFTILHGSLDFFKFGSIVRQWTQILYRDFSVSIQNNGNFSEPFEIKKGVHQGGCCSSVYFLVIAEILALSLRHNEDIEGLKIKDIKNLLNQFADDMDIFSKSNQKLLQAVCKELESFRKHSGFTVSYDKTTLYRIGSLRHSNAQLYDIDQFKWSNEDITVLGVTISHEDIVIKNYDQLLKKTDNVLNAWYNRSLSLIGKVQVVNTLVASLYVYKMMVLPTIPRGI